MVGEKVNMVNPIKIEIRFATNSNTVVVDFTESSFFSGVIIDMGKELTRGSDTKYSFISVDNNVFALEGNSYGDALTLTILE